MLSKEQDLLAKIAEEASEVAQMALKCQHFGIYEKQTEDSLSNIQLLLEEYNDLLGVIRLWNDECSFQFKENRGAMFDKMIKVRKYAKYSHGLGQIEWNGK